MSESRELSVRPQVRAGGQVQAFVPQSVDEAWRMSQFFAEGGLTPKGLDTPAKCFTVICAGAEVGFGPFQSLQAFAMINGRLAMWGDAVPALLWSHGFKVKEWVENESDAYPDNMTCHCEVTRPDGEVIHRKFSIGQAKRAKLWGKKGRDGQDTPWITFPDRMLQMRARGFAARDGAPDVMRGIAIREEMEDVEVVPVVDEASNKPQPLEADGPKPRRKKAEEPAPVPEEVTAECPHCGVGAGEAHEEGCPSAAPDEPEEPSHAQQDEDEAEVEPDTPDDDGFPPEMKTFIDSVESATTFGQVKGALQTFFATKVFRDMPLAQQNRMRGDTWDAIAEKKEEGQMLDLPDHAQDVSAFRLWIEAQPDHEAIAGTFNVLKTTPNYAGKDDTFKANFQKAVDARIALLTGT